MSARIVFVDMPKPDKSMVKGDRLPVTNPLHVGYCEGVVEDVIVTKTQVTVDLTVEVDGIYLAKVRGTSEVGKDPQWTPLRMEVAS